MTPRRLLDKDSLKKEMNNMKDLHKNLTDEINKFKEILINKIKELPDNPVKSSISSNCFIICSSQLEPGRNLSPLTYDFAAQYTIITELILKSPIKSIPPLIQRITKDSSYHPTVRKSIKNLWENKEAL